MNNLPTVHAHSEAVKMEEQYESPAASHVTVGEYLATRFSSLKPSMDPLPNPFKLLTMLNLQQWLFFAVGLRPLWKCLPFKPANYLHRRFLSWPGPGTHLTSLQYL
jgi:hypothetical protein